MVKFSFLSGRDMYCQENVIKRIPSVIYLLSERALNLV